MRRPSIQRVWNLLKDDAAGPTGLPSMTLADFGMSLQGHCKNLNEESDHVILCLMKLLPDARHRCGVVRPIFILHSLKGDVPP
jgi:hypothetical protein